MALRFKRKELLQQGFRRILKRLSTQVEEHLTSPTDRDEHIHQARVALKRLRALIRLVRAGLPNALFGEANFFYRDLGRQLSEARDAMVMLLTWNELAALLKPIDPDLVQCVHEGLLKDSGAAAAAPDGHESANDTSWQAVARWQETLSGAFAAKGAGWGILQKGLKRTYRQGQEAMRQAQEKQDEAFYHEWRKRVKDRTYQIEYLAAIWEPIMTTLEQELKRLADLLGKEHDWAMLKDKLTALSKSEPRVAAALPKLKALIEQQQEALRSEAHDLGSCLYADQPGPTIKRMHRYWQAWRRRKSLKDEANSAAIENEHDIGEGKNKGKS